MASPMFSSTPVMGATAISGNPEAGAQSTSSHDKTLLINVSPLPFPPIPGTSPAQARPSQTRHPRQAPCVTLLRRLLQASGIAFSLFRIARRRKNNAGTLAQAQSPTSHLPEGLAHLISKRPRSRERVPHCQARFRFSPCT